MASSKVMASTSPPNPDLPRQPSSSIYQPHHHLHNQLLLQTSNDHSRSFGGSMNVDDFLKNIYSDSENFPSEVDVVSGGPAVENGGKGKMLEEVWGEIASSGGGAGGIGSGSGVIRETEMTLEDFLTKAGAVSEEDVRVPVAPPPPTPPHPPPVAEEMVDGFVVETMMTGAVQFPPGMHMQNGPPGGFGVEAVPLAFANGSEMVAVSGGSGGAGVNNGRRRRRVDDAQIDKASQQKQRRMIKNRESAARSRERKQAYTIELESLVAQLEEENARLVKEEAEWKKQRLKQLLESLVPVEEKQKPPRVLRRVNSVSW